VCSIDFEPEVWVPVFVGVVLEEVFPLFGEVRRDDEETMISALAVVM